MTVLKSHVDFTGSRCFQWAGKMAYYLPEHSLLLLPPTPSTEWSRWHVGEIITMVSSVVAYGRRTSLSKVLALS